MNPPLILVSVLLVIIGIVIMVKADQVGAAIVGFYRNYPLVRHAGQKQFVVKRVYVIALGAVIFAIGIAGILLIVL